MSLVGMTFVSAPLAALMSVTTPLPSAVVVALATHTWLPSEEIEVGALNR